MSATAAWSPEKRLGGLRRFAAAITLLNLVGHLWLGFETSWAHPLAALCAAYGLELLFETLAAREAGRVPRYLSGGWRGLPDFFLSAHITAMAVSMLLYPGARLAPVVFATAVGLGSKVLLQLEVEGRRRHVMNPSNLGIAVTLLLFPSVGIAPPYQFTEALLGVGNWVLPAVLIVAGTLLNARFTGRLPLIGAWLVGFALQAAVRHVLFGAALGPALLPMTGLAFLLFTFYMITDPPTTPSSTEGQVVFGLATAAVYGLLMSLHVVFGLFFSLVVVCAVRSALLWFGSRLRAAQLAPELQLAPPSAASPR